MRTVNRGNNSYPRSSQQSAVNSRFVAILAAVVIVIFAVFKFFGSDNSPTVSVDQNKDFMTIIPTDSASVIYIAQTAGKDTQISSEQKLFPTDAYVLVEQGSATSMLKSAKFDFDEKTQLSYLSSDINSENVKLEKGRIWLEVGNDPVSVELKRLTAKLSSNAIAMIEQTNTAFSVVYAIRGNVEIQTSIGQYTLPAGKGIKISDSNLANSATKLTDLVDEVDASLAHNSVFIRNNGEEILKTSLAVQKEETPSSTNTDDKNSPESTQNTSGKYISFTQPTDGSVVKTLTMSIMGTILKEEVARVTINDIDAVVSPVNQTFSMQDFKLTGEINNIVYKVYDANGIRLDMGVLVVHGPKNASAQTTIIPQNFPISDKDFIITSPGKNPFATTDSYVRVQGKVPRNTVKYITVNDYRLQKFIPNSETWYYHANADIGTIKEGTNLYYIKFFDNNDKLLHTLLFTIIKDSKNANTNTSLLPS